MAVTSGFYNSMNSDRRYDSDQMSKIFDGIIADGVYATIYNQFAVSSNEGMTIQVDTGRAWFNHRWVLNDGILLLTIDQSEVLFDRIDAVVIEVDNSDMVRNGFIKVVKGTPSATPSKPTLTKSDTINQYPLAYITVGTGVTEITTADIQNAVGTSECPFVTGVVSVMDIDMLVRQWGAQWEKWYKNYTIKGEQWMQETKYEFELWFEELKTILDGDIAANLAKEILELKDRFKVLAREYTVYDTIDDSDGNPIQDDDNYDIEGGIIYVIKERS